MHINAVQLQKILKQRGLSLRQALQQAGVSRTAYYALLRQSDLLPTSLRKLADALSVAPDTFISTQRAPERRVHELYRDCDAILAQHPEADRQNVFHTLVLLDEPPIQRLQRSLQRGRRHIYR